MLLFILVLIWFVYSTVQLIQVRCVSKNASNHVERTIAAKKQTAYLISFLISLMVLSFFVYAVIAITQVRC